MTHYAKSLRSRPVVAQNRSLTSAIDGVVFTGSGTEVVKATAARAGIDSLELLQSIVKKFLVKKGTDWTAAILSEYARLYDDSRGIFAIVWDDKSGRLASHGAVFQSSSRPWGALLAHIRTAEEFQGLGLGTLVTEEATAAAFRDGAGIVALATDDKINRFSEGERTAQAMYSKLGYAILGKSRLADTVDWLMAVDEPLFQMIQRLKGVDGCLPNEFDASVVDAKRDLVDRTRASFARITNGVIEPVRPGDLPALFLLLNLGPEDDFQLKLTSWQVQSGPEIERTFITTVRQAIVDCDRLHDASLVLRDGRGAIAAICAAQLLAPFTRRIYAIDFYCLPALLATSYEEVIELVRRTIERIGSSSAAQRPCELSFLGVDRDKIKLFESLGFALTSHTASYYGPDGQATLEGKEYRRWIA